MIGLAKLAPGPGHVALVEREPRAPGPGEVLIEVHGAGICGTDLHIEAGEFPSRPPVTMGHEVAGCVAALGDGVDAGWLGASVVSETYYSTCRQCTWCRAGRINLCPDRRSIGSVVDGAFAPRLVVPATNLHRLPDWLGAYAAVLIEPLACVCHCLCDPPLVTAVDRVLVTGPGPVGLLAAQVARALGGDVLVVGLPQDAARLEAAAALGLRTAHAPEPDADVVIECSGAAGGATACLEAAGRRARYVQVGVFGRSGNLLGLDQSDRLIRQVQAQLRSDGRPGLANRLGPLRDYISGVGSNLDLARPAAQSIASPIRLDIAAGPPGREPLSALGIAGALVVGLGLVGVLLAAALLSAEREDGVLSRLGRGLAGPGTIVAQKALLASIA
jgi:L-iditol 2-dehydrogenase